MVCPRTLDKQSNNYRMTAQRLSRLQRRILAWLEAEYTRTKGTVSPGNQDLVKALSDIDKVSISRRSKKPRAKGTHFCRCQYREI